MGEMNCVELVERVTDYLEAALSSGDRARMDDHLEICVGCQAYLSEIHVTLQLASSLSAEHVPAALESGLLEMYRKWAESIGA